MSAIATRLRVFSTRALSRSECDFFSKRALSRQECGLFRSARFFLVRAVSRQEPEFLNKSLIATRMRDVSRERYREVDASKQEERYSIAKIDRNRRKALSRRQRKKKKSAIFSSISIASPVQDATTDAMSSGVTSSRNIRDPPLSSEVSSSMSRAASSSSSSFCRIGTERGCKGWQFQQFLA